MELPYLKIEPEKAIQLLDSYLVQGYQKKDQINSEYNQNKATITPELINKWDQIATQWSQQTIMGLQNIFVSLVNAYNFRDAEISPFIIVGENKDWNNIIKYLDSKIKILNQYNAEIKTYFNIKVEVIGRDKVTVSGSNNKLKIKND